MIRNYADDLSIFRADAVEKLMNHYPIIKDINERVNSIIKDTMNYIEQNPIEKLDANNYTIPLMVSFIRTQFICTEHIFCSEIVEATVLLRKQMELIARLNEINGKTMKELKKKTPQISALKTKARTLYGPYSTIAHSADLEPLQLLGISESGSRLLYKVYPEYSRNTIICYSHYLQIFIEYTIWLKSFFATYAPVYNFQNIESEVAKLVKYAIENKILVKQEK